MIRYFLYPDGKFKSSVDGTPAMVELNTPADTAYFVDDVNAPSDHTDFWDEDLRLFISVGTSPSEFHVFNYISRTWVDPRTLDEIKAQKWIEIKSDRDRLEFGGFEFEGNIYDSDQVSQGRILGAASAGLDQVWTLADNTTVNLTADQLVQLYQVLQVHIAAAHERGRVARQAIMTAITKEDIEAVTL
jgi:hypothetical protein